MGQDNDSTGLLLHVGCAGPAGLTRSLLLVGEEEEWIALLHLATVLQAFSDNLPGPLCRQVLPVMGIRAVDADLSREAFIALSRELKLATHRFTSLQHCHHKSSCNRLASRILGSEACFGVRIRAWV